MSEGLADLADWDLRARQGGRTDDVQVREQARRLDWMVRHDRFVRLQLISGRGLGGTLENLFELDSFSHC